MSKAGLGENLVTTWNPRDLTLDGLRAPDYPSLPVTALTVEATHAVTGPTQ